MNNLFAHKYNYKAGKRRKNGNNLSRNIYQTRNLNKRTDKKFNIYHQQQKKLQFERT